jgi:antitoxin ParD1/3/4
MGDIGFSPEIRQWIASRVANGDFADEEDYLLELIRRDKQAYEEELAWLREKIAEGLASGISEEEPETIIENIIARRRARRG